MANVQKMEPWKLVSLALRLPEKAATQRVESYDDEAIAEIKTIKEEDQSWPMKIRSIDAKFSTRVMERRKPKQADNESAIVDSQDKEPGSDD